MTTKHPSRPMADEMIAEGREKVCAALRALAEQEVRPRVRGLLLVLCLDVKASESSSDLHELRANFAWRKADDYYRRQWDAVSDADPALPYEEHIEGINQAYWARRVVFGWRWPGKCEV